MLLYILPTLYNTRPLSPNPIRLSLLYESLQSAPLPFLAVRVLSPRSDRETNQPILAAQPSACLPACMHCFVTPSCTPHQRVPILSRDPLQMLVLLAIMTAPVGQPLLFRLVCVRAIALVALCPIAPLSFSPDTLSCFCKRMLASTALYQSVLRKSCCVLRAYAQ